MSPKFQQNGSDPPTGTWAEPLRASALLHHSQSSSPLSLSHSAKSPTSHRNRNKNAIKPTNKQNESVLRYRSCQSLLLLLLLRTQRDRFPDSTFYSAAAPIYLIALHSFSTLISFWFVNVHRSILFSCELVAFRCPPPTPSCCSSSVIYRSTGKTLR